MKKFEVLIYVVVLIAKVSSSSESDCEENEVWSDSSAGCQKNCATKNLMYKCRPVAGCVCDEDFIRASSINNTCIPIEMCESCSDNETFSCGNPFCEETCDTLDKPCAVRILRCEDKCYCDEGFVRESKDGPCVLREEC